MVLDVFHISTMSEVCITCHSPGVHPTQGLIGVPSVTNHRSMASVPTMYFLSLNKFCPINTNYCHHSSENVT